MTHYDGQYDLEEAAPVMPRPRVRFDPTRRRGEETYIHARRHSRLVRLLKIVLPALALIGVVGFFLFMQFAPLLDQAAFISSSGINIESRSLVMDKPNISGFEGTRHAYEVKAEQATQALDNPQVITLETIEARFGIADGVIALVNAATGVFDSDTKLLALKDGLELKTTSGYTARFEDAIVDFDKGTLVSSRPLEISTSKGSIHANAVEVEDRGSRILFYDGVTMTLAPDSQFGIDSGPAEASPDAQTLTDRRS